MNFDVVIAGGGPNGLMVASELALAGLRAVVLEKLTEPTGEQRANGMAGQVVQLFHRRGLYGRLTGDPSPPVPVPQYMFAAFPLPLADLADNPVYTVLVPQRRIEAVLAERALELGVEIRRGHSVTGFTQKDDSIVVSVDGSDDIEARYLVGADGGKSLVRKLAGIDFPGFTSDRTVSRTAHVTVPPSWRDPVTGGLLVPGYGVIPPFLHHRAERGLIAFAPFPDGRTLLSVNTFDLPEGAEPFDLADLRAASAHVFGVDIPLGPPAGDGPHLLRRLSGGQTRLAEHYRAGRVFLVGDAAHVHSAIGGPGLNLGLQDAVNLAWKLAASVHGWAPEGLLDTYEAERRPAGERVTMHTQAQHLLVGPGAEVSAMRTLFGELLEEPAVRRRIAELIAGSDRRFVPDLGELTHSGRPLLVDNTGTLAAVAAPWRDRVDVVTAPVPGATAMLVRPDCIVAWTSSSEHPDQDSLRAALAQWFG
ncbi:FAD-dependent monooxygenase [Actinoplanes subtropicus]|uniref:FAD-dependent monooxygenase n=1 Tax=Actinoplanes subtropicus TaxID=543632 RepID=UPI0004C340B5|nr:FAD-dependent monooxygenase [Actinoplanes subtropicus]